MPVVRDTVAHAGFKITKGILRCDDEKDVLMAGFIWDNLPLVEKTIDAIDFTRLRPGVKINKFPGFLDLNRKDCLWKNFRAMQKQFGREAFGFHPDTFQLPAEHDLLVKRMEEEDFKKVYIVKLPNNFCGIGACVIDHPKKIPVKKKIHTHMKKKVVKEDPIIVQSYIQNPFLINGYKFDFRIYVLVTSINPLRIYLYKDGLVRFTTQKFSLKPEDLSNTLVHLTNFAVNKNAEFLGDYPPGCQDNKWSVYELWAWLRERGQDPEPFWSRVKDVVIKTILCGHKNIDNMVKKGVGSFYNNYNLLGLDIFIDTDYKPHLLEVNTIPSLFINKTTEELDLRLKGPIVAETLNICGHHISSGTAVKHKDEIVQAHMGGQTKDPLGFDHRLYCKVRTESEEKKQQHFTELPKSESSMVDTLQDTEKSEEISGVQEEKKIDTKDEKISGEDEESEYETDEESEYETEDSGGEDDESAKAKKSNPSEDILADLTPCDVRVLVHSEEELTQCETFERIFPTSDTGNYLEYMETNYYDLLLLAWERRHGCNRQRGRDRLAALTSKGVHLEVPAAEKRAPRPPPKDGIKKNNFKMPHIYRK